MNDIQGRITFHERDGVTIATVEFPEADIRFYVGAAGPADLKKAIMQMVEQSEMVARKLAKNGRLNWEAL